MLNNFESNIAQRINNHEEPFQEMDWNAMETALNTQESASKKRRGFLFMGLSLFVFVLGFVTWKTFYTSPTRTISSTNSTLEQNSKGLIHSEHNHKLSNELPEHEGTVDRVYKVNQAKEISSIPQLEAMKVEQEISYDKKVDHRIESLTTAKRKTKNSAIAKKAKSAHKSLMLLTESNKDALLKGLVMVGSKENHQELIALETRKTLLQLKNDSIDKIQDELKIIDIAEINKQGAKKLSIKPFIALNAGIFADQFDSTFSVFPHLIGDVKFGWSISNRKLFKLELSSGLGYRTNLLDLNFARADYSIVDDTTTLVGIRHHYNSLFIPIEMKYCLPLKLKNWEFYTALGLHLSFIPNQHTDGKYTITKFPISNQGQPVMQSQQVVFENKNLADLPGSNSNVNLVSDMVVANRNKFYLSGYASFGTVWKNRWMLEAVYLMESSIGSLGHKHNLGIRLGYKTNF